MINNSRNPEATVIKKTDNMCKNVAIYSKEGSEMEA